MQQDNIKDFAVAAFRLYGNNVDSDPQTPDDQGIINAVKATLSHLAVNGDYTTIAAVKDVYCQLPCGYVKKGTISAAVQAAATAHHADARTIWRKLKYARQLFKQYYKDKTLTQSCQ